MISRLARKAFEFYKKLFKIGKFKSFAPIG